MFFIGLSRWLTSSRAIVRLLGRPAIEQWWPVVVGDRGLLRGIFTELLFFFCSFSMFFLFLYFTFVFFAFSPSSGYTVQVLLHRKLNSLRCLLGPVCIVALYDILNLQALSTLPPRHYSSCLSSHLFICFHPSNNKEQSRITIHFQTQRGPMYIWNIWPLSSQRLCSFVSALHPGRRRWVVGGQESGWGQGERKKPGCSSKTRDLLSAHRWKWFAHYSRTMNGWRWMFLLPSVGGWGEKGRETVGKDPERTGLSFSVDFLLKALVCAH